ncbi:helix-turn-helix domain-containing protein, partial [Kitasatospora sp. NPDC001574]
HLAAAASEAASFAAWLAWDMADHGSARAAYGQAINSARAAGSPLLLAYQIGSLAQMEAHLGNGATCLSLANRARTALAGHSPAVADAWLAATEALGHSATGDTESCDHALLQSAAATATIPGEGPPPWPWVFPFDESKVNAIRATCGARLGRPTWTLSHATAIPATAHSKQHALALLDLAAAHLAVGRYDAGFHLAVRGLDIGLRLGSGRIVERARALRRTVTTTASVVQAFDDRLHNTYL